MTLMWKEFDESVLLERLYISGSLYIQRHMRTNECVLDVLSLAPSLLEFFLAATNLMNYQKKKKNTADSEEIYWLRSFENILPDLDY